MKNEEVLKLVEAGFTAAEIRAMQNAAPDPAPAAPDPDPVPADPEPKAPDPAPAPAPDPNPAPAGPDPLDAIKQQIQGLTDVVDRMSKALIMPNLDDVTPQGIDDIVSNFFKED